MISMRFNFILYLYIGTWNGWLEFRFAFKNFLKAKLELTDKNLKGQGQSGQEGGKERKVTVDLPFL